MVGEMQMSAQYAQQRKWAKKPSQHEILSMISDCTDSLSMINRHIRRLTPIETWVKRSKLEYHMKYNGWEQLGSKIMVDMYWYKEMTHLKRLRYLKHSLTHKGAPSNGYPTQEEIERAKSKDIEMLYDFNGKKKTLKGFTSKCPWHTDSSPSFSVRNNFFKCFGSCNLGGDAIGFIQKEKGLSFIQAVAHLNKL